MFGPWTLELFVFELNIGFLVNSFIVSSQQLLRTPKLVREMMTPLFKYVSVLYDVWVRTLPCDMLKPDSIWTGYASCPRQRVEFIVHWPPIVRFRLNLIEINWAPSLTFLGLCHKISHQLTTMFLLMNCLAYLPCPTFHWFQAGVGFELFFRQCFADDSLIK